ncbi:MAG: 4-hydroxy-3-methylbut-2-enyl diphosphate reductase [Caldiserica bacterium]|nr:MAG: 4-hydroxy-3-methylbut-2-enyl diphosphate reductase [Caldisericota bacterium]
MRRVSRRKIIIAKNIGFCSGVERAVKLAEESLSQCKKVYTLDALLHNEKEMQRLKEKGVSVLTDLKQKGKVVLLPAHGSTAIERKKADENFEKVINTVCPFVLRTVQIIEKLKKEHYKIAIVGDRGHREVKVLSDAASYNLLGVFQDRDEIKKELKTLKIGVVAQSTMEQGTFFSIVTELITIADELIFFNTICKETLSRQAEAKEIAKKADCMLVIGDKTSANSCRLFQMVKEINEYSYFIQTEDDLVIIPFERFNIIGIASGTSTPYWLIEKVVRGIKK